MADAPDWEVTTSAVSVTATKLQSGLDAAKSASPTVGDCYLATNTLILYVCVVAGAWTGFDAAILVQGTLLLALIPALPASQITSGRFGLPRMPDGTLNYVLTGQGAGVDPAYSLAPAAQPTRSAPGRALDTIYQNTTGKPILVIVNNYHGASTTANLEIGAASPPATIISRSGPNPSGNPYLTVVGLVPNNWYYRVATSGSPSLFAWEEITW